MEYSLLMFAGSFLDQFENVYTEIINMRRQLSAIQLQYMEKSLLIFAENSPNTNLDTINTMIRYIAFTINKKA